MLKVGITGGIGSGKTIVCRVFETLGIPVFNADTAAKYLMEHDRVLMASITQLFGADIYRNDKLQREHLAAIVFKDASKLEALNRLVHPATIRYGAEWMESQKSPYVVKEAAIFFESGSYKQMDIMIGVAAPLPLRIKRAMQRDNISVEKVRERIAQQMDQDEKMNRCRFVILNDEITPIIPQVLQIHAELLKLSEQYQSPL